MDDNQQLRQNIRMLGSLLGRVLQAQGGESLLQTVEQIHALSKSARLGNDGDWKSCPRRYRIWMQNPQFPLPCICTFLPSLISQEQHHRVRRHRAYNMQDKPQRGSIRAALPYLLSKGNEDNLHQTVSDLQIELVLTTHPTEVNRRTLLQKHNEIARLLSELDYATRMKQRE